MVPHTFPQREGLDMYASMTPAKEVGGEDNVNGMFVTMLCLRVS